MDSAILMWDYLLIPRYGKAVEKFIGTWKKFLESRKEAGTTNGIKRDEWNMLLILFQEKGMDVDHMQPSGDDENWPLLFDSFFEYLNQQ
mmetsp:Transcript_16615/g.14510  ORF Transcript_16615/g.14510 Transcript_16615/m.14510 type:complete len:89 (+) Transcript_16615:568-834(+)